MWADDAMHLEKTDKGVLELASRQRTLGLKERALLLLADGQKPDAELVRLLQAEPALLMQLVEDGYLRRMPPDPRRPRSRPPETAPAPLPADATAPPRHSTGPDTQPDMLTTQTIRVAADNFEGKRSLATARLFLFDISERLLARRDPTLNADLRERLRQARDREGMLVVARDLLIHVEAVAGAARADNISERLAALLPDESLIF
jgi:hypothetical protein